MQHQSSSSGFTLAKDITGLTSPKTKSPAKINAQSIGNKMSDFRIITELGRGSYGVVYRVVSLKDQLTYVLKKIILTHLKPKH
jgi:NIMA (never in mitosis gene a)-related kinase